eukprot:460344-Rhodomonas_salina.1
MNERYGASIAEKCSQVTIGYAPVRGLGAAICMIWSHLAPRALRCSVLTCHMAQFLLWGTIRRQTLRGDREQVTASNAFSCSFSLA